MLQKAGTHRRRASLTNALREARVYRSNRRKEEPAIRHHSAAKKRAKFLSRKAGLQPIVNQQI